MNLSLLKRNNSCINLQQNLSEGRKRDFILNRLLDSSVHLDMKSESNLAYQDKHKYLRKKFIIHSYDYDNNDNIFSFRPKNSTIDYGKKYLKPILYSHLNRDSFEKNYDNNDNNNDNDNSKDSICYLTKPFHKERRHFPKINNQGIFFKDMTNFLIENTHGQVANAFPKIKRMNKIKFFSPFFHLIKKNIHKKNIEKHLTIDNSSIPLTSSNPNIFRNRIFPNNRYINSNFYDNNKENNFYESSSRYNIDNSKYKDYRYNCIFKIPGLKKNIIKRNYLF